MHHIPWGTRDKPWSVAWLQSWLIWKNIKKSRNLFFEPFFVSGELRSSAWLVILHKGNQSSFQRSSSEPYIVEAIWNRLVALSSSRSPSNTRGRALRFFVNQCKTEQSQWVEQIAWATGHSVVNCKVKMHFPAISPKEPHGCSVSLKMTPAIVEHIKHPKPKFSHALLCCAGAFGWRAHTHRFMDWFIITKRLHHILDCSPMQQRCHDRILAT